MTDMKPRITRLGRAPSTALVCCSHCFQLISYHPDQALVACPACGTTVRKQDLPTALDDSVHPG